MTIAPSTSQKNILLRKETIELAKFLEERLFIYENGCEYKDNYSDEKVAIEVPFVCTAHNVRGLRTELFGVLLTNKTTNQNNAELLSATNKKINLMEGQIKELQRVVLNMVGIINDLCDSSIKITCDF